MGTTLGKPFAGFFHQEEARIVLFGLGGTGKSSIMHKFKTGETLTTTMPTVGKSLYHSLFFSDLESSLLYEFL